MNCKQNQKINQVKESECGKLVGFDYWINRIFVFLL